MHLGMEEAGGQNGHVMGGHSIIEFLNFVSWFNIKLVAQSDKDLWESHALRALFALLRLTPSLGVAGF